MNNGAVAYDASALEAQALKSLEGSYALLIDPTLNAGALSIVGTLSESDDAIFSVAGRVADIADRRAWNARFGLRFVGVTVRLLDQKIVIRDGKPVLAATEDLSLSYEVSGAATSRRGAEGQRLEHEFIFDLINGIWTLTFDRAMWHHSAQPVDPNAPPVNIRPLADRPDIDKPLVVASGGQRPAGLRPVAPAWGTYNPSAAVNYAHTYVYNDNPAYVDIPNPPATARTSHRRLCEPVAGPTSGAPPGTPPFGGTTTCISSTATRGPLPIGSSTSSM